MFLIRRYNAAQAFEYATKWALSRNPLFYDFSQIGGDCTNFISQCVLAGTCQMNYDKTNGWYYISADERAPSWTSVQFFYDFITQNKSIGPFGREIPISDAQIGDIVQLGRRDGTFYHSLLVTSRTRRSLFVTAHSDDALNRPLRSYSYRRIRCIRIDGANIVADSPDCFNDLLNGISL